MANILPVAFYSGNRVNSSADFKIRRSAQFHQKLRKIEEKSKLFMERPLLEVKKESCFAPHRIWEIFPTQSQALDYEKRCKNSIESRIFVASEELSSSGRRNFIVSTFEEFWRRYKSLPKEKRHFYEVIPEGQLCRLYFDLEFYKSENPGLQGADTVEVLIDLVCFYLLAKFDVCCSRGNIIDLESSTKEKFSRHLIFHIPDTVFSNNVECGNFVTYIYEMVRRKLIRNEDLGLTGLRSFDFGLVEEINPPDRIDVRKLFVNSKDGKKAFFADLGVYTKNRNFRLYGSSKFGKDAHLVISNENGFHGSYDQMKKRKKEHFDTQYLSFLNTLVCYYGKVTIDLNVLTFADSHRGFEKSYTRQKDMECKVEEGYRASPYPKLDAFILTQINQGGIQGTIRRWMHFVNSKMMLYDIGKNHFCENIGRAHKSNHVYFIVDMKCGVFYQKCHDPECADYKSGEKELPEDLNPMLNDSDFLIEDFDSTGLLCDAVEIAECGESFVDDNVNDPLAVSDDAMGRGSDASVINCCTDVCGDFCSDSVIFKDWDDNWDFEFKAEIDEGWNRDSFGTNESKGVEFVGNHCDTNSFKKCNKILKANDVKPCKVTDGSKNADFFTQVSYEEMLKDLHVSTSPSGKNDFKSSELSSFQNLPHKGRKDRVNAKTIEIVDYAAKYDAVHSLSSKLQHEEEGSTSFSYEDRNLDTSLMRNDLSDFYLDSDLDDELVLLD